MKPWSNIQVSPDDPEIIKINNLEKKLGDLPDEVKKIRELITRFEVCHFKYQHHLKKIKDSIINLESISDITRIGINHIQHGESAWKNDTTGKSLIGQQYVWAIKGWLNDSVPKVIPDNAANEIHEQTQKWLGDKNPEKIRLIRLLLARLTWDWKLYEKLQHGEEFKDLEFQTCRIDICHYAFPKNLDLLLQGIGNMKPVKEMEFEGCGSYDNTIKTYLEKEFIALNDMLKSLAGIEKKDNSELIKVWLVACLLKTIKENVNLSLPIAYFAINQKPAANSQ
jgi:hypothetical protein